MNYVNKTVDKREPSFPDNSDGKAEFLYGYLMKKRKVVTRRPLIQVNRNCSPIWDKYDG